MNNSSVFSNSRVAGLTDRSVFEVSAAAKATTKHGDPWLRWARAGDYSGWYSIGERKPDFGERLTFWEACLTLATEAGNGALDAVHCIGPGILSVGGLGVTLSSGYAQALLADCLEADPLHWLQHMGKIIRRGGAWIEPIDGGVQLVTQRGPALDHKTLNWAVRRGAPNDQWNAPQKHVARVWVEGVSRMLRNPKMDQAQVHFCQQHIPQILMPIRPQIDWPRNGIQDGWMYTLYQQALWCVLMVAAIEDEDQTWDAVRECIETTPKNARLSLKNLFHKPPKSNYSDSFVRRLRNAVIRAQELFHIQVL